MAVSNFAGCESQGLREPAGNSAKRRKERGGRGSSSATSHKRFIGATVPGKLSAHYGLMKSQRQLDKLDYYCPIVTFLDNNISTI